MENQKSFGELKKHGMTISYPLEILVPRKSHYEYGNITEEIQRDYDNFVKRYEQARDDFDVVLSLGSRNGWIYFGMMENEPSLQPLRAPSTLVYDETWEEWHERAVASL